MGDEPTYRTGKLCYIELPATDVLRSAEFYRDVFGWHIRNRDDGEVSFDDTVHSVSGTWVLGGTRPPAGHRSGRERTRDLPATRPGRCRVGTRADLADRRGHSFGASGQSRIPVACGAAVLESGAGEPQCGGARIGRRPDLVPVEQEFT